MNRITCTLVFLTASIFAQTTGTIVDSVTICVGSLESSLKFYEEVLGFERLTTEESYGPALESLTSVFGIRARFARLRLGREEIELVEALTPEGRPMPRDLRGDDAIFQHLAIVVSDMDLAYSRLREHRVRHLSTSPQQIPESNVAAAGVRAFYFKDPEGHPLELIWFPKGKGDPRWQEPSKCLFLGIDHSALTVADTKASLPFHRDLLGLSLRGESVNSGLTQEHLNLIQGCRVHISGLRGQAGFGVEYLDFLIPEHGRSAPPDLRFGDLMFTVTNVLVSDLDRTVEKLETTGARLLSKSTTALDGFLGLERAVLVLDRDGHAYRIGEARKAPALPKKVER